MATIDNIPDAVRMLWHVYAAIRVFAALAGWTFFEDGSVLP